MKTHYEVYECGSEQVRSLWKSEGLTPNKTKFCDGLMLGIERQYDFVTDTDHVDCMKCQKKIDIYFKNGFELPFNLGV